MLAATDGGLGSRHQAWQRPSPPTIWVGLHCSRQNTQNRGLKTPEHRTAYDTENRVPRTAGRGGGGGGTHALSFFFLFCNYGDNYSDINLLAGSVGACL